MTAYRCGYCGSPGSPGSPGRCETCGSAMEDEDAVIEGARYPHLIRRWLANRDRAWRIVDQLRKENPR